MSSKTLMPVRYVDTDKGISLRNFSDTVVYDDTGGQRYLCAIRFGGYPEQVEAMSRAISGGGSLELIVDSQPIVLNTLVKKYRRKVSHDDVYAECTLIAEDDTQQAEESDAGPKNNVREDEDKYEQVEIADLPPRSSYIYVPPGDRKALFDAVDQKTAVPLIPEFADYLLTELERKNILVPLKVYSGSPMFDAWVLKCAAHDKNIIAVVEEGLKTGAITIPGAQVAGADAALGDVNSVTEYLIKYGPAIAERIKNLFVPLFDPEKDQLSPEVLEINRVIEEMAGYSLYDAQLAVAEAIKRQLARRKVGLIIAECGAGKTKIGLSALAPVVAGLHINQRQRRLKKTFNVILCPSHISKKWVREIEESLPDTFAAVVGSITELDRLYDIYAKGDKSCYAVISKEAARDGYMRAPAAVWNKRKKAFVCPDCGGIIEMLISQDGTRYKVNADQFFFKRENRENHKCEHCGSMLWTVLNPNRREKDLWVKIGDYGFVYRPQALKHLDKVKNAALEEKVYQIAEGTHRTVGAHRKYPLSTYLKNHYKGRIDGLIVDELHQYNNDSGQGDAMCELFGAAKKVVGMTATLINGYSSGIFYLLYRLVPGLMMLDGKPYGSPSEFVSEYGVVETAYEITEADYNANRRTTKRKKRTRQLPGVSPLVYSRFLLEYAAFLSLTDMGKDLPEYEEIPVPLKLPKEIANACGRMQDTLIRFMKNDKKVAQKILSAYLNLLTAYPDQPYNQPPILHPIDGYEIVTPPDLADFDTILPKDEAALDIVKRKIEACEKVLIYTNWTRLDTQQKLLKLLTEEGYRTDILPAKVKPNKREEWVANRLADGLQVLITNPSLVETGLDLNAFTTLIFYDTGYKLFTLRQASRRSWRINQTAPRVEVYMLYYMDTMQHKAMKLMASKLAVAAIIEGGFSEEGLAAMSQCEDMTTLMAKELMMGIKDNVEDVSAAFKRMAFLKNSSEGRLVAFADKPVPLSMRGAAKTELVEFTFIPTQPARAVSAEVPAQVSVFDLPLPEPSQKKRRRAQAVFDENQLTLFNEIAS